MSASIVSAQVSGSPFTLCASARGPAPTSVVTATQPLASPAALQILCLLVVLGEAELGDGLLGSREGW